MSYIKINKSHLFAWGEPMQNSIMPMHKNYHKLINLFFFK